MKIPKFPDIEGYPCTDPDLFWGYACAGHVPLHEFIDRCRAEFGDPRPQFTQKESAPCHAFVSWRGKGWWFCFPDDKRAKPITYWPADSCSYCEWLMQMLKDICHREQRDWDEQVVMRIVRTMQSFFYASYRPAMKEFEAAGA